MLKVSSHQSVFCPWIGFWNKVAATDLLVVTDGIDFNPRDYEHRLMLHGSWATLVLDKTVVSKTLLDQKIVDPTKVAERLTRELLVKRYRWHARIEPLIDQIRQSDGMRLVDLNGYLLVAVNQLLDLPTRIAFDRQPPEAHEPKHLRLKHRLERYASEFTYYSRFGTISFLNKAFGHPVMNQVLQPVEDCTILQLIAGTEYASDCVRTCAQWEAHELPESTYV
jgi:hypothetical protein